MKDRQFAMKNDRQTKSPRKKLEKREIQSVPMAHPLRTNP
jgi:hypothetical protein